MNSPLCLPRWLDRTLTWLALVLCCLPTRAASLTDFGYRNLATPAQWPLLVVLANFTDGAFDGSTNSWDAYMFGAGAPSNTLNGFFSEVSNGRFQFTRGATIQVSLSGYYRYSNVLSRVSGDNGLANTLYCSNIVYRAMLSSVFSFAPYDTDNDGVVQRDELNIAIVNNDDFAATRGTGRVKPSSSTVAWDGKVSLQTDSVRSFDVMCHEVCHTLDALDLYGAWEGDVLMHQGLSIMSSSGGACHLDPWHKLQFGWTVPRLQPLTLGGLFVLPAASSGGLTAPLLLYEPSRYGQEFFLLEYRTSTNSSEAQHYDLHVADDGLIIWHIYHTNKMPVQYADLVYPAAETGWRECLRCRTLVHLSADGLLPCANTNSTNGLHELSNTDHRLLTVDDPTYGGQPGWRQCGKCGCLFYNPYRNQSICRKDGGLHVILGGSSDHYIRTNVTDKVGQSYWRRCVDCQELFIESQASDMGYSSCPRAAQTRHRAASDRYTVLMRTSYHTVMAESPPDLHLGDNVAWKSGMTTPRLRWYDGIQTPYSVHVLPFEPGATAITVEILSATATWEQFSYSGVEAGTFAQPFNTLVEGVTAAGHGGTLHLKTGTSSETGRVTKRLNLEAYGGSVRLGR